MTTFYNHFKSITNWTKEYLLSDTFKRVTLSIITLGGYHYYHLDKQYALQKDIFDLRFKLLEQERESRKMDLQQLLDENNKEHERKRMEDFQLLLQKITNK